MRREAGSGTTEYVGVVAVVAFMVVGLLMSGVGMYVAMRLEDSVALITGAGPDADAVAEPVAEPAAEAEQPADGQGLRAFGPRGLVLGAGPDCEVTIVGGALDCEPPADAPQQGESASGACEGNDIACVSEEALRVLGCSTPGGWVVFSVTCEVSTPPSPCGTTNPNGPCVPGEGPGFVDREDAGAGGWFELHDQRVAAWEREFLEFNRRRPGLTPEQERAELERLRQLRLEAEPAFAQDAITSAPGSGIPQAEVEDTCVALCGQIVTGVPWRDFHEAFGERVSSLEALHRELNDRSEVGNPWVLLYHPEYEFEDERGEQPHPPNEQLDDTVTDLTDQGPIVVGVRHPAGGLHSVVVERVGADLFRVQDPNFGSYEVTSSWFSRWAEIVVARP
jgi:hypothetical protein